MPRKRPEQPFDLVALVQHAVAGAGVALVQDGGGAEVFLQLHHLLRDFVQRLVPADALELVLAARADALHGVEQALGRIQARAVAAPAQAGAQLRLFKSVLAIGALGLVFAVVGRQAHDHVALLVRHQHVARAAVVRARGDHGGQLVVGEVGLVGEGLGLFGCDAHADADQSRRAGRGADDL
ncbi:hypothetical protein MASR1M50_18580 [Burkholderiales bacterium]